MKKIAIISHGCPKNLVDSELMFGKLSSKGYEVTLDENDADIVIVNTCSFICDAEKESVRSILENTSKGKKVIVAGCLAQKHSKDLKEAIPEIKAIVGTTNFDNIDRVIEKLDKDGFVEDISTSPEFIYPETIKRQQITAGSSSYIKIADGCNYRCGYCIIPYLRGDYHSRKMENIIEEAKELAAKGVSEIILIAQDTTSYGIDLYKKPMLAELLKELNKIENLRWIRFMYAYPTHITNELLDTINNCEKVVKYLDIPLQHSHSEVLKAMNRPVSDYTELIKNIRSRVKDISIRTAFIVGYPGETEEQFDHLCEFIKKNKFDRLGVFCYSREKGTPSYSMKPQIPKKIAKARYKKLMEIQQEISYKRNKQFIGKKVPCIIEFVGETEAVGRTQYDAPEIDGVVRIKTDKVLIPSDIEDVKITDCTPYDLIGEV